MSGGVERLLDRTLLSCADLFLALLLRDGTLTYLPELYEVFGPEKLVDFLDIFAGATFEVPSTEVLSKIARDISVYHDHQSGTYTFPELARKYDLSENEVKWACSKVSEVEKGIGL